MISYAVIPRVLPNYLSYTLFRFEINVRAASVIGFVGAGGIGQELMFAIRQFLYQDVYLIDILSKYLRDHFIGGSGRGFQVH